MRVPLWLDDVAFCTVSVGRSVADCSPFTGETGAGAVSVTVPDHRPGGVGAVGPTGTCACRLDTAAAARLQDVKTRRQEQPTIERNVVMYTPRYSSNNEPIGQFIYKKSIGVR